MASFFREFLAAPAITGAVAPSSLDLARLIVQLGARAGDCVVELGPGTGAFTAELKRAGVIRGPNRYLGLEINGTFVEELTRRFPDWTFVGGSAIDLAQHLQRQGIESVDCYLSGLPWASLPSDVSRRALDCIQGTLSANGRLVTFAYIQGFLLKGAWRLRSELRARFDRVRASRVVWNNLPPAFVWVAEAPRPLNDRRV